MINYLIQFLLICLRHKRSRIFIGNKLYKTSKVLFIFTLTNCIEYYSKQTPCHNHSPFRED